MSDVEQEQDQSDHVDEVDEVRPTWDDADVLARVWGADGRSLMDQVEDGDLDRFDARVESWFRDANTTRHVRIADWIQAERESEEQAQRERQEQELASSDDALREQIRTELAEAAEEADRLRREERIRAEVIAEQERERAGAPATDPIAAAVDRLVDAAEQLDRRDLTEQERTDLWARAEEAEDALAATPAIDIDPADFEQRLDERIARGY